MASPSLVTSFWDAAVLPLGHEEPVSRLRSMIVANQYPRTCSRTCNMRKFYVAGTMQNHRRMAVALMQALLDQCTLVPSYPALPVRSVLATGPELQRVCDASNRTGLDCYFLPLSNCSSRGYGLNIEWDASDGMERIGQLTGLRSELLLMGTLLSWVMRPQPELAAAIEWYGASLGLARTGARPVPSLYLPCTFPVPSQVALRGLVRGTAWWRCTCGAATSTRFTRSTCATTRGGCTPRASRCGEGGSPPTSAPTGCCAPRSSVGPRFPASFAHGGGHFSNTRYMSDDRSLNLTRRGGPLFRLAPAARTCARPPSRAPRNVGVATHATAS